MMKKFLLRIATFTALLFVIMLIGFMLPTTPKASTSLLMSKKAKDSLLKSVKSPRIIFIGGSNLSFGLNSQLIKDSLHLNPINTAIHASIGLEYMMFSTLPYIKKGDIIVIAPEYYHFYGRTAYGNEVLLRTILDNNKNIFQLSKEQLKNVLYEMPKYLFSKFRPSAYFGFKENEIYSVNTFNIYGDANGHWNKEKKSFKPFQKTTSKYNKNVIQLIKQFETKLHQKKAKLYISYPPLQDVSFDNKKEQIQLIEKKLLNTRLIILGIPEKYKFSNKMFFNTPYHLTKKGADIRTQLLIKDLKKALNKSKNNLVN